MNAGLHEEVLTADPTGNDGQDLFAEVYVPFLTSGRIMAGWVDWWLRA